MARFAASTFHVLFLLCALVCVGTGFAKAVDWSLALPASLPFLMLSELAAMVRYRLDRRRAAAQHAADTQEPFRFITSAAAGSPRKDRAA